MIRRFSISKFVFPTKSTINEKFNTEFQQKKQV